MALSIAEEKILKSIVVPSENDPERPEFPPDNPRFPATPTYKIKVPGFSNVWLKDDSVNKYSGTHKDRLAWEVVILYRNFLLAKQRGQHKGPLPVFSIISSGSAALAIGRMLRDYNLPKLKVLVDVNLKPELYRAIKNSHCEIYKIDLSRKALSPKEILKLTNNPSGFDLTSNQGIGLEIGNYDWMSYEMLNHSPDYCFIPTGTGIIFRKILEINKLEVGYHKRDHRFDGNVNVLRNCNFMGATTKNPKSKADKLYAPFLPFNRTDKEWLRFYKTSGFCGKETGIYDIEENFLDEAMEIAKEQGINCEPSGIAGLALLLQMKDKLPKDKKMLIVNTGKTKIADDKMSSFIEYGNKKVDKTLNPDFMTPFLRNAQTAEFMELCKLINNLYSVQKSPLKILDIGVGDGRIIAKLNKCDLWSKIGLFVGFDNAQIEIEQSNKLVSDLRIKNKVKIVCFDANNLGKPNQNEIFKQRYDLIICTYFTPGNFKPDEIKIKMGENGLILPYPVKCLNPNEKFVRIFKGAYSLLTPRGNLVLGSIYIDSDVNRLRQEDFYRKCGMTVITSKKDSFTATKEGFWSQRFTKQRIYEYFSWLDKNKISFISLDDYSFAQMITVSK